jgi:hypothetical protein
VETANRLVSGTTSIPVGGPGRPRLAAVGTLVSVEGLGLGLSVGILKGIKLVALDVLGNWIGSFKDGISHGSLVGITIGAAVDVVETEGFTQRPGDDSDGEPDGDPLTIEAVVDVENWLGNLSDESRTDGVLDDSLVGITIGAAVGVVETEGFTNRPGDDFW